MRLVVAVFLSACGASSVPACPCDDGDPCNGVEVCDGNRCLPGVPMSCDDADPCTVDLCTPAECGHEPRDLDGDGHADRCAGGDDCAPENASRFPGAPEVCNGIDDDCDLDIDEGLPIELLEVEPLDDVESGRFRPWAILPDGTRIGHDSGDLLVFSDGVLQRHSTYLADGVGYAYADEVLFSGSEALLFRATGPVRSDPLGRAYDLNERVVIERIVPGQDPVLLPILEIERTDEPARPIASRGAWTSTGALFVWMDQSHGLSELRSIRAEAEAEPRVITRATPSWFHLSTDPGGSTVLWLDERDGGLQAVRLDSDGAPNGETIDLPEPSAIVSPDACPLANGTALAYVTENEPGRLRVALLDTKLRVTEWAVVDANGGEVHCLGRSVLLLAEAFSRKQLFRVGPDEPPELLDAFESVYAWLVQSQDAYVETHGEWDAGILPELRRYGCRP